MRIGVPALGLLLAGCATEPGQRSPAEVAFKAFAKGFVGEDRLSGSQVSKAEKDRASDTSMDGLMRPISRPAQVEETGVIASLTGSAQPVFTVTGRAAWQCTYNYAGQIFSEVFEGACPSTVRVQ